MKFLIDVNLSPRWEQLLTVAGWQAAHWSRFGPSRTHDSEIMAYAADHNFIVITHDLDFGSAPAVRRDPKPSVIQIRYEDVSPDVIGAHLVAAIRSVAEELEAGALLVFDLSRSRLRLLPFS